MAKRRLLIKPHQMVDSGGVIVSGGGTFCRTIWNETPIEPYIGYGYGASFFPHSLKDIVKTFSGVYNNQNRMNNFEQGISLVGNVSDDNYFAGINADNITINTNEINSIMCRLLSANETMTIDGVTYEKPLGFGLTFQLHYELKYNFFYVRTNDSVKVPVYNPSDDSTRYSIDFVLENESGVAIQTRYIIINQFLREIHDIAGSSGGLRFFLTMTTGGEDWESTSDGVHFFVKIEIFLGDVLWKTVLPRTPNLEFPKDYLKFGSPTFLNITASTGSLDTVRSFFEQGSRCTILGYHVSNNSYY